MVVIPFPSSLSLLFSLFPLSFGPILDLRACSQVINLYHTLVELVICIQPCEIAQKNDMEFT